MPTGQGHAVKMGIKREALVYAPTWPAAAPAQVDELLPVLNESLSQTPVNDEDNSFEGGIAPAGADVIFNKAEGRVKCKMRYEGFNFLIGAALGFMDPTKPDTVAAGVYRHLYEVDSELADEEWKSGEGWICGGGLKCGQQKIRRGTAAIEKQVSVHEFLSLMIKLLTITGNPGGVSIEIDTAIHSRDRSSAVNTAASMAGLSDAGAPNLLFHEVAVRVAPFSASTPLGSGDEISISEFEVVLENPFMIVQDSSSGAYIAAPVKDGETKVTGGFTMPRYGNDVFFDNIDNDTILMGNIKFTGPEIGATGHNYEFNIYLPSFKLLSVDAPAQGPGSLRVQHKFSSYKPAAAPAGFPANIKDNHLMIEMVNAKSSHPLL